MSRRMFGAAAASAVAFLTAMVVGLNPALAGLGAPTPGQLGLQLPATESMAHISSLYDIVNAIIIAIAAFVLVLLIYVMYRFSEKNNPTPSRTTHNTMLEVAWTIIPIMILVAMAIPSFRLLYEQYSFPPPNVTIKATGNAWFWEHEYFLDGGKTVTVTSNGVSDEDVLAEKMGEKEFKAKFGELEGAARHSAIYDAAKPVWEERNDIRRMTVDQEIAVPVNQVVHMLVTSADVIHAWTIPSFGVKMQAVPGRTAAVWFKADKVGSYHGQCSVLCGKLHSAMPIVVRVVDEAVYKQWVDALVAKDRKKAQQILKADAESHAQKNVAAAASLVGQSN